MEILPIVFAVISVTMSLGSKFVLIYNEGQIKSTAEKMYKLSWIPLITSIVATYYFRSAYF